MIKYFIYLSFLSFQLFAVTYLNGNYYVSSDTIKISDIIPNTKNNFILYTIIQGRYTKRVKSRKLIALLNSHGLKNYKSKHSYTKFTKKSPIDVSKIKKFISNYYIAHYKEIDIINIAVNPRGYIQVMPKEYTLKIRSENYLHKYAIISLKSSKGREIFFDYIVNAKLNIYKARKKIKREEELSMINTVKKSILLDKFKAKPIQEILSSSLQSKYTIKENSVITTRDVKEIFLIKKGSNINVSLTNSNMSINFLALALQNGCLGDTINVLKHNGKRIRVKVIGKHRAEVQ